MAADDEGTLQFISEETASGSGDGINTIVCKFCLKQFSKYTCPRCNIQYCSIDCYRCEQHSLCSEQFYKECFIEALKEQRGSDEEKRKMLEILKRVEEENDEAVGGDDDENVKSIEERLAGLDLDKDTGALWEKLTGEEKQEFQRLIKEGKLGGLVTLWKPWWKKQDQKLIEEFKLDGEMQKDTTVDTEDVCQCPRVLEKIPKLTELLKSCKPADCVQFNLVEVVFTYVYIVQFYNGSHFDVAVQSTQDFMRVSRALSENQTYNSTEEAIHSVIHRLNQDKSLRSGISFMTSTLADVIRILTGPSKQQPLLYMMAAMSDLHRLLTVAKRAIERKSKVKPTDKGEDDSSTTTKAAKLKTKLFHAKKKVLFLMAWCVDYSDILKPLALEVHMEYVSMKSEEDQQQEVQNTLEETWGGTKPPKPGKKLIEELN